MFAALPPVGDASATVQYAVSSSPRQGHYAVIEGGVVTEFAAARASIHVVVSCTTTPSPACLTATTATAFMDGSFKVEGDHKAWLIDLRDVRTWRSALGRSTDRRGAVRRRAIADQGHPETFEAAWSADGQDGEVVEAPRGRVDRSDLLGGERRCEGDFGDAGGEIGQHGRDD